MCDVCQLYGASIECCSKNCKKSMHLPCALESKSLVQFIGNRNLVSCSEHIEINEDKGKHGPEELCLFCSLPMEEYFVVDSINLAEICCLPVNNSWVHKKCMMQHARAYGTAIKCFSCKQKHKFQKDISKRGIFVPDKCVHKN